MEPTAMMAIQDAAWPWAEDLRLALNQYLDYAQADLPDEHVALTASRVVESYADMIHGIDKSPEEALGTFFPAEDCDQMIHRSGIRVVSTCGHHLLPFIGKADFAYIPDKQIVGISKIPRLIQVFSRRLQFQERLTNQIVEAFQELVQPAGCALCIRAYHLCEIVRGVEEPMAVTRTTALRGCFKENEKARTEFLDSIDLTEVIFP